MLHKCFSSILYKSKTYLFQLFEGAHLLTIPENYLFRDAKLKVNVKSSFIHALSSILPSFSKNTSKLLFPKSLWKNADTLSFRKYKRKVVSLVIHLFNYSSSKSTFFMLSMEFDVLLSQFLSNKLEFFVSCNVKITRTVLLCVLICTFFIKS